MKRLQVFQSIPPLDGRLVHSRVIPSIKFASHLYSWVERVNVRVKCLAQEHNTMSLLSARTQTAVSREQHTNREDAAPLQYQFDFPPPCHPLVT